MRMILTPQQLAYLGTRLATALGFTPPSLERTARLLANETVTPLVFENAAYRMWLDPDYIAVENRDTDELIYVYVTMRHIEEEMRDDLAARKHGCGFIEPPTRAQFCAAKRAMRHGATLFALRLTSRDSGLCGANAALDLKTPWRASLPEQQPPLPICKSGVAFAFR